MLPLHEELKKVPLLAIILPLIMGIIVQETFFAEINWVLFSTVVALLLLLALVFKISGFLTILLIFLASFSIGSYSTYLTQKIEKPSEIFFEAESYLGVIQDIPSLKNKKHHSLIRITKFKYQGLWQNCNYLCQAIINDSAETKYLPAHEYLITSKIHAPQKSILPGQFDYAHYLRYKGIFAVAFININEIAFYSKSTKSWRLRISDFRYSILKALNKNDIPKRESSILSSFLLGYRGEIDPELNKAFASAGASHILSVSGMHVGIVFLFLNTLLKFLNTGQKQRVIKSILVICCLWFYALLAGFSPPVLRSAFMFSLFALADITTRKTININILAFSAIILLTFNPYFLFDVGFQLSYAAMLGIFLIYVPLSEKWLPQNTTIKYFYSILLLSFAAQVGTLPLILYYFQQFPAYFLLTNLLIVPWSVAILYVAIIYALSLPVAFIAELISFPLKWLIFGLNQLVLQVEELPGNLVKNLEVEVIDSIAIALIIVFLVHFVFRKNYPSLAFVFIIFLFITIKNMLFLFSNNNLTDIYTFSYNSEPAVIMVNSKEKYTICQLETFKRMNVKNYIWINPDSSNEITSHDLSIYKISTSKLLIKTSNKFLVLVKEETNPSAGFSKILIFNKKYELINILTIKYRRNEHFSLE